MLVNNKISKIEETKRYTDRCSAKVEGIFSELTKRLAEVEKQKESVKKHGEMLDDMVKSVDKIEVKVSDAVKSKDLDRYTTKNELKELLGSVDKKDLAAIRDSIHKVRELDKKVDELNKNFICRHLLIY